MSDWHAYIDRMSSEWVTTSWGLIQATASINNMIG
jgi:hypothetical protein